MTKVSVLGITIQPRTRSEAMDALLGFLGGRTPRSVYFVHAATANLAFVNPLFRDVLNRGHVVFHDGAGLRWAARRVGARIPDNLVGTDLLPSLFDEKFDPPLRVYLLGGGPGVAERAARTIARRHPGIEVAGWHTGYFSELEEDAVVAQINALRPDLLLVGMGNPRQELFIDRNLPRLQCRVAVGVGGLFDHWSGALRRASPRLRRWGLEWLQLLTQQPHKWRRYILGIPQFLWRTSSPGFRTAARGVVVSGVSLALSLMLAEGLVRLIRPQILERYPQGMYVASETRQYQLRPGFRGVFRYPEFRTTVQINGQGLRSSREYGTPKLEGRRVLAVGDSFTMAYSVEVEQTWTRLLEARLGSAYEVINAGVPGYSTWQELTFLEEQGLRLRPNIVLLGFFMGNDVTDNAEPRLPVVLRQGRLLAAGADSSDFRLSLARSSHLYGLISRSRHQNPNRFAVYDGGAEAGWAATEALIARFSRLCRDRYVRPIVVLMPEELQVNPILRRRVGITSDPVAPNRRMREICRSAGVEVIDLLRPLSESGLYFPQDGHWTPRGNAAAARAIFQYLSRDAT